MYAQVLTDTIVLLLRLAMVAVLYLFLLALVATLRRDLARSVQGPTEPETPARLVVLDAGPTMLRPGQVIPLQITTSFGRDATNTIVLPDNFVSGRHAVLAIRDGSWWLRDLGSTNGTQLNQQHVHGEIAVEPGDVIGVGRVRMKLST